MPSKEILLQIQDGLEKFKVVNNAKVDSLKNRLDDFEAKNNRIGFGGGGEVMHDSKHSTAFNKFMRTGDISEVVDISNAMSIGSDPDGGFTVPFELDSSIEAIELNLSPMRQICRVRPIKSAEYKQIKNLHGAAGGWIGDTDSRPETGTPKLAEITAPAQELYAFPMVALTALEDSSYDLEAFIAEEVGTVFGTSEGAAFITGNGVKKPRGILSYPVVVTADATRKFGELMYIPSGAAGAFASGVTQADCLVDLVQSLKPGYRKNGVWLMNAKTLGVVRKFKDTTGNFIWETGLKPGQPSTLLGYPVYEDENMPDVAANSLSIAFGDFKRGYIIVDRITTVLRDAISNKPYVGFYTRKRVGGMLTDSNAIKLLKFAAS